jgi:hypothetical protein
MGRDFQTGIFDSHLQGHHSIDHEKREAYVQWLSTPTAEREPPNETQWCKLWGISRATVYRWKNDYRFAAEVSGRLGRHVDLGVIPDVIVALTANATNPDSPRQVTAAKTLLEYVKWNIERTEELNAPDLKNLSDEDLSDLMLKALDAIDSR